MKIKTRLQFICIFTLIAVLVLSVLLFATFRTRQTARSRSESANTLIKHVFEQRQLLQEYLLFQGDRAKEQWLTKNQNVKDYVANEVNRFTNPEEKKLIESIQDKLSGREAVFEELTATGTTAPSQAKAARLTANLIFDAQAVVSDASTLANINNELARTTDQRSIFLIVLFLIIILTAMFLSLYTIWSRIVIPLIKLEKGTEVLASGNLKYTIEADSDDEMGKLSRAFNNMAHKLSESYSTLQNLALQDALTGLPNRKAIEEEFKLASPNHKNIAILFLDLDRFKMINDTLGHLVGDMILKEAATRFRSVVREHDSIARLGGDEFMLLLKDFSHRDQVAAVADRLLRSLDKPMIIDHNTLQISTSIGIALHSGGNRDFYGMLKNADVALYKAKEAGRNKYIFYDEGIDK